MTVTAEWLSDVAGRVLDLACECETRFGEPSPGVYPSEVEMLLHMAHNAAYRQAQQMRETVND